MRMRNKRITAVWRTRSLDRNVEYQVCLEGVSRRGHWPLLSLGARLPPAFGDVLLFVYGVGLSGNVLSSRFCSAWQACCLRAEGEQKGGACRARKRGNGPGALRPWGLESWFFPCPFYIPWSREESVFLPSASSAVVFA